MNSANQEKIYEWMESRSFSQLLPDEIALVLEEMNEETYSDMHAAIRHLDGFADDKTTRGKEAIWEEIDRSFRQLRPIRPFSQNVTSNESNWSTIPLSWAAAVVLLLLLGLSWSFFRPVKTEITEIPVLQKDTVLVEVQVPKEVPVYDTVYLQEKKSPHKAVSRKSNPVNQYAPGLEPELHIQSPSESEDPINRSRRNSLQYDTLVEKIGFVSL